MKILHVITNLDTGGAEKLLVDLLPKLNDGSSVALALFQGKKTPFYKQIRDAGVKIHSFSNNKNVYHPSNIWKLAKLARGYDVVHTHNTACQLYGAIAGLFGKSKWCTTEHTTTSHHRVWWFVPIERWMYSRYDYVICISDGTKATMQKVAGRNPPPSSIIYNGIDVGRYANANPCEDIPREGKIVTMVGRWSYQKDQATIIRAMAKLPSDYKLWLAGYGETEQHLRNLAAEQGVVNRVCFLGMRTDVPNVLKSSDIVVQSSHIEGFGLAAVEGMAAGKPVIASDVTGLAQVVEGAGVLFPHENADALAREIEHVCTNQVYYNELVRKGKERAAMYDISAMAEAYMNVYKKLLK